MILTRIDLFFNRIIPIRREDDQSIASMEMYHNLANINCYLMDLLSCYIPPTVVRFSWLGISPVVVGVVTATNVVELSGFLVVCVVKENVLCKYPSDDAPAWSLTPFLEITVILYNAAELRLEIVTWVVLRSSAEGQNFTPEQLLVQKPMFEHVLHCKSYVRSVRPPSYEGRDHVTTTTFSAATVTLMFVGADGGAGNDKNEMGT